jgi:hypothetical protein
MKGQNTLRETEKVRIKLENENVRRSPPAVKREGFTLYGAMESRIFAP